MTLFRLAGEIAEIVCTNVDLIDLRAASTVMQYQVVTTGQRWWQRDSRAAIYESTILNLKTSLDEARAGLIDDIEKRGTVHG